MVFSGYLLSSRLASCHLPSSSAHVCVDYYAESAADAEERERLKGLSRSRQGTKLHSTDRPNFQHSVPLEIWKFCYPPEKLREASADGHFIRTVIIIIINRLHQNVLKDPSEVISQSRAQEIALTSA